MKNKMTTALLISTYNWPKALSLILKSVANQTKLPDQIIIADDGSTKETKDVITAFKKTLPIPVIHIWHEDDGFRKSIILNKAIAQSNADYIIQIDGDCIIHRKFVADHILFASKNQYLYGSRVNIKQEYLPILFEQKNINFNVFHKGIKKRTRTLHIPALSCLYKSQDTLSKKMRGCNVSYWKEDFIKVNGYNEAMTGWGREDSEVIIRMMNTGVKARRLRYRGIVYHIWHNVLSKQRVTINDKIQEQAIKEKLTWCEYGVDQYL